MCFVNSPFRFRPSLKARSQLRAHLNRILLSRGISKFRRKFTWQSDKGKARDRRACFFSAPARPSVACVCVSECMSGSAGVNVNNSQGHAPRQGREKKTATDWYHTEETSDVDFLAPSPPQTPTHTQFLWPQTYLYPLSPSFIPQPLFLFLVFRVEQKDTERRRRENIFEFNTMTNFTTLALCRAGVHVWRQRGTTL